MNLIDPETTELIPEDAIFCQIPEIGRAYQQEMPWYMSCKARNPKSPVSTSCLAAQEYGVRMVLYRNNHVAF
jgi:hypothetical protein